MPGRFSSPQCPRCLAQVEDFRHRYFSCSFVSSVWEWVLNQIYILDAETTLSDDYEILSLSFSRGFRDNAIIWLVGVFVEHVERNVVLREQQLELQHFLGDLRQRKQKASYTAMPDLGIIPGVDFDPVGVG